MHRCLQFIATLQFTLSVLLPVSADPDTRWPEPGSLDLSFEPSAEMSAFLSHPSLNKNYDDIDRARSIVKLLFGEDGSGFEYDPNLTLCPKEAFEKRKGNCITFAMLFTTLARAVDMHTRFNEIRTTPSWNRNRDLVIETGHVNVVVSAGWRNFVVEWLDSYRDLSMLYIHSVSDDKIRSDFYNNLGIQALAEKEYQVAHDYITYARAIDPKNPGVWQNYGVLLLHQGQVKAAESAFLTGAKISGTQSSIYFLLSKLYDQQGKPELSQKYFKKGEKYARKNPFYHYQLAIEDVEQNQMEQALNHLKRAIEKLPDYHLFHFTKAQCHQAMGEHEQWQSELQLAISMTQTPEILHRYRLQLQQPQTTNLEGE